MNEIDAYIEGFPEEAQKRMRTIRDIIREEAPEATERICMRIPTYELNGKWFLHFAGFQKHIGFYPQPERIEAFAEQLRGYKTSKGTVQFPHNRPLPLELIREMARYRVTKKK